MRHLTIHLFGLLLTMSCVQCDNSKEKHMTEKTLQPTDITFQQNISDSIFCYHLRLTDNYNSPDKWTEDAWKTIEQHTNFLENLGKSGILIFAGRTLFLPDDKRLFGIALIKAKNIETAKEILSNDPAVVKGIQQADIFPFSLGIRHFDNIE